MTKELSKAKTSKYKVKNRYIKYPSQESFLNLKKIKYRSSSISQKTKKQYVKNVTKGVLWMIRNLGPQSNLF